MKTSTVEYLETGNRQYSDNEIELIKDNIDKTAAYFHDNYINGSKKGVIAGFNFQIKFWLK